jgi:hypothetical protein
VNALREATDIELRELLEELLPHGPLHFDADHVCMAAGMLVGRMMRDYPRLMSDPDRRVTIVRAIRIVAEDFERRERAVPTKTGGDPP